MRPCLDGALSHADVDLEHLLYDEWVFQRRLLRGLLAAARSKPVPQMTLVRTWQRLEGLSQASRQVAIGAR